MRRRNKKQKKIEQLEQLEPLLDEVEKIMGKEFCEKLRESIDETKWKYYQDGKTKGYYDGIGAE